MIRAATSFNAKAIKEMIRRQHAASKYADRSDINDRSLDELVDSLIGGQGSRSPGGTYAGLIMRDGRPVAFVAGQFSRLYQIGNKLIANDAFLINEGGRLADTFAMIDGYLAWARGNRRCIECNLTWVDTVPGAEKVAPLYMRRGFVKTGEMYEMRLDLAPADEAEGIAA